MLIARSSPIPFERAFDLDFSKTGSHRLAGKNSLPILAALSAEANFARLSAMFSLRSSGRSVERLKLHQARSTGVRFAACRLGGMGKR
jgi:hypothetical protein